MKTSDVFYEVTALSNEDCFLIFNRVKNTFHYPIHVHSEIELNFIENAMGARRIVGDSIEEIDDLELCLIANEKLEHGWINGDCVSTKIHEITVQFHRDLFLGSLLNKKQFHSLSVMFENAKKGIVFSKPVILKIKNRLDSLISNKNEFYSVIELINILYELSLDDHSRMLCNSSFINDSDSSESRRIQKVINYLETNYQKNVSLNDVAKHVGMTDVSFSRFMKKRTGKNFIEYFNDLRLGFASHQLVNTNKYIAEVAFECGFDNLSNFNRIFKKRKGCTPTEFRNGFAKMRKFI
ncbi:MAG: AraC family transcriptional regulator [Bacteroidota bacterium]|nr:AraC family transcriptional regulator [Bacteroidota bacterium]